MRSVTITQPRTDCVVVDAAPDWRRAFISLAGGVVWCMGLVLAPAESAAWWVSLLGAFVLAPVSTIVAVRALQRHRTILVRSDDQLLLNGDPLELARVELRSTYFPITRIPTGCSLSLWVMTLTGPADVYLGHFSSLMSGSLAAGRMEQFLGRAPVRHAGRTTLH